MAQIKAYCMKTKEKNVPMINAVIKKNSRGGYMAHGTDADGNKMVSTLSEANALDAIKTKHATKGF